MITAREKIMISNITIKTMVTVLDPDFHVGSPRENTIYLGEFLSGEMIKTASILEQNEAYVEYKEQRKRIDLFPKEIIREIEIGEEAAIKTIAIGLWMTIVLQKGKELIETPNTKDIDWLLFMVVLGEFKTLWEKSYEQTAY